MRKALGVAALLAALGSIAAGEVPQPRVASVPSGARMLARAEAQGVALPSVAAAIVQSRTLGGLALRLKDLGLLKPQEAASGPESELALRDAVQTLWAESASHAAGAGSWDRDWAVPALVVENGGRSFYIHGVNHGFMSGALDRRAVAGLSRDLKERQSPLLIEQKLKTAYRLDYGQEVNDGPRSYLSRAEAAVFAALPLRRWRQRRSLLKLARRVERAGLLDRGLFLRRAAQLPYSRDPGETARRLELPLPLKESVEPGVTARSRALAEAALASTSAQVHVLTGWSHVFDVAWLLAARS